MLVTLALKMVPPPDEWFGVLGLLGSWQAGHLVATTGLLLAIGIATYVVWLSRGAGTARRPILMVIDDLDRCSVTDTVEYLETIHTLMRCNAQPRLFPRWRAPAPLLVLALADGRWVRAAFEKQYETFAPLGDRARTLGADFIQKLFDHTVLVPELTGDQVQRYVALVTKSPEPSPVTADTTPPQEALGSRADSLGSQSGNGDPGEREGPAQEPPERSEGPSVGAATTSAPDGRTEPASSPQPVTTTPNGAPSAPDQSEVRQRVEQAVRRDAQDARERASAAFAERRGAHLLASYPTIMPGNPRLIRRVVNTWGMLDAVKLHVGHHHDDETLVRAAVFFVRFPSLVDELINEQSPITIAAVLEEEDTGHWRRTDIMAVLRLADGTYVEPHAIGECYGRQYASWPDASDIESPRRRGGRQQRKLRAMIRTCGWLSAR